MKGPQISHVFEKTIRPADKRPFRNWIKAWSPQSSDPQPQFPSEANRYHLIIAYACPWASRCLMLRSLKKLDKVISLSVVHPTFSYTRDPKTDPHVGWHFKNPSDPPVPCANGYGEVACDEMLTGSPDPYTGAVFVRDIYENQMKDMDLDEAVKKSVVFSVPILWCKKTNKIVNNESEEIIRMLNSEFNEFCAEAEDAEPNGIKESIKLGKTLDLFPEKLRDQILAVNSWVYTYVNRGVYRCGFALTQASYDEDVKLLFEHLDLLESMLSKSRYLVGDVFTEADVRLFVTLIRFDEAYVVHFKTSKKCLREYPNLLDYCREIYQITGVAETVQMDHIRLHYYTSHSNINPRNIVAVSPNFLALMETPHQRGTQTYK